MRRRAVPSELPYTNPAANCNLSDANGKYGKNTGSKKLLPSLLVAICVVVPCVYGLSRLRSGGSGGLVTEEDGSEITSRRLHSEDSGSDSEDARRVVDNGGSTPSSSALAKFGQDTSPECPELASRSECTNNRVVMLSKCPDSCDRIAGVSVTSLSPHEIAEDAVRGYAHFLHDGDEDEECIDLDARCETLAEEGRCMGYSDYMEVTCPKSCHVCFGTEPRTVTINYGVEQQVGHADPVINDEIMNIVYNTQHYMIDEVYADEEFEAVRKDCRNLDPHCSVYAAMGECHGEVDAMGMQQSCAPACRACAGLEHWRRCLPRAEDVDAMQPGDLNGMFERIVRDYPQYKPNVLSRPAPEEEEGIESADKEQEEESISAEEDEFSGPLPWIVTLDNFFTDAECDWLIAYGYEEGFEQTGEITEEIGEDGTYGDKVGEGRTSMDVWCQEGCADQPVGRSVMERMVSMTKLPEVNTEPLEILKYETGGHYESHHDVIPTQPDERCGGRIITIYVFLSDVEEGGELRFNYVHGATSEFLEVTPRKGMAVIWQNVLDSDLGEVHENAFHEAMRVKKGKKYGANQWFHLRDMRAAQEDGCCEG